LAKIGLRRWINPSLIWSFSVAGILTQLELDRTFFIQFATFSIVFLILSRIYFRPFLHLFEARHKRTIEDREAAERLMSQAQAKLDEYKTRLAEERAAARRDYEAVLNEAKKEEATILYLAREESRKITHEAAESVAKQHEQLKRQLEVDAESLARSIAERLVPKKG
jgi:F0F1-type ATP synthase membrane subunit b/b'